MSRAPLADMPTDCPTAPRLRRTVMLPGVPGLTPGVNSASWTNERPFSGRSTTLRLSITVPTLAFRSAEPTALASTETFSEISPTLSCTFRRATWSTFNWNWLTSDLLKSGVLDGKRVFADRQKRKLVVAASLVLVVRVWFVCTL